MSKYRPIFPLLIALLLAVCLFLAFRKCDRQPEPKQVKLIPAEIALQNLLTLDSIARLNYQRDTAMLAAANQALKRELSDLKGKLSTQTTKAQQSALNYQKTPTLSTCSEALKDCHEESETKSGIIAVQDRLLTAADSSQRKDRKEIARSYAVSDSLGKGWDAANKALKKEKGKRFGVGVMAGYGFGKTGFIPFVGVGIQYTIKRF